MEKQTTPTPNKKNSIAHKAGDAIERVGEKITKAGAPSIGKAVYKAGDKLEHAGEKEKSKPASSFQTEHNSSFKSLNHSH